MRGSLAAILVMAIGASACEQRAPAPAAEPETVAAPAEPQGAPAVDPAAADACSAAHNDVVKIVEAMKATMQRAGNEDGQDYAPPARERFLELCQTLPPAMQRCLIVSHAALDREGCQKELEALGPEQKATYAELMGK